MDEPAETKRQAPIDPRLLEILVCPLTKGPLEYDRDGQRTDQPQGGPRLSGARRHPDHAARGGAQAGGMTAMPIADRDPPEQGRARAATSRSTMARASRCRPNTCASKARAPRCRAMARTRSRSSPGKRHVGIIAIEPVGNYAVRLVFDDLHDTGIYSWDYLHELGREQDQRWPAYLAALDARGLSREPPELAGSTSSS